MFCTRGLVGDCMDGTVTEYKIIFQIEVFQTKEGFDACNVTLKIHG